MIKKRVKEYAFCTLGSLMFVFGVNVLISPLGLYNGGFVGISQLVRYFFEHFLGISVTGIDVAGVTYFLLNVPLFILAYQSMNKHFFLKTVYTVILQTMLLSFMPMPKQGIIDDVLTTCIIGGVISGVGVGIILRSGASGGGQDILGVYFAKKIPGYSVGKMMLLINGFVYGICAVLFELEVVIYSVIYTVVMSLIIDKVHIQNINNTVFVFSKKEGLEEFVIHEMKRGVTVWKGKGGYTKEDINIGMIALSKYEIPILRAKMAQFDENAFLIVDEGAGIYGNFEKRLEG